MYDEKPSLDAVADGPNLWEAVLHVPTSSGIGSLERFYDAALVIPVETTALQIVGSEVNRIARSLAIVRVTASIPRRLGGDADNQDLAIDKKRGKRVAHALSQSLNAWTNKPKVELDEEVIRREGAQLDWSQFASDHYATVQGSLRIVATWSVNHQELRWGRSSVVNLTNELSWIRYALRD